MTIYKLVADSSNRSQRERQTDKERQRDRIYYLHRNIFMSIISAGTLFETIFIMSKFTINEV